MGVEPVWMKYGIIPKIVPKQAWRTARAVRNAALYGQRDMFSRVNIETSTICTRACEYCPISKHPRKEQYMDFETWKEIIDQLAEIKYREYLIPNGYNEPLADKRLPQFIRYARENLPNTFIQIYTNGDLMGFGIFNRLLRVGVDRFVVSLHEPKNNFMRFYDMLDEKARKRIAFNITGADSKLNARAGLVSIKKSREMKWKTCNLNQVTIKVNGDIVICCMDYFGEEVFGNIQHDAIMDVWNSQKLSDIRKNLARGIADLDICKRCLK